MASMRGVLFDLDGTLLDTETLSTAVLTEILEPLGASLTWELNCRLLGLRGPDWSRIVVDDQRLEGRLEPAALVCQWEASMAARYHDCALMRGAETTVSHAAAIGLALAVCTSSSAAAVSKKRLTKDALFAHFRVIVAGDDAQLARGKPAPDIFLLGAARLGVEAEQCVVFEDTLAGCAAGRAAGAFVVGVPDTRLADRSPFGEVCDVVLESLDRAPALLDELVARER